MPDVLANTNATAADRTDSIIGAVTVLVMAITIPIAVSNVVALVAAWYYSTRTGRPT